MNLPRISILTSKHLICLLSIIICCILIPNDSNIYRIKTEVATEPIFPGGCTLVCATLGCLCTEPNEQFSRHTPRHFRLTSQHFIISCYPIIMSQSRSKSVPCQLMNPHWHPTHPVLAHPPGTQVKSTL